MMESIGDGVIATDGRGRVRLMNPVAQALTGWTQAEAVGRPIEEVFVIVNEETRQPAENPVFRAIREGVVMGLANHTVLIARGGAETSIDDSAAPIKGRDGGVVGVVMVFQDATERRRHEAALRESEERHRTILESITDAFFALDRDWRFTYVNRQAEALLGRSRDDCSARASGRSTPETVGNEFERAYRRAMDEGRGGRVRGRSTRRTTAGTRSTPTRRRTASRSTSGTSPSGSGPRRSRPGSRRRPSSYGGSTRRPCRAPPTSTTSSTSKAASPTSTPPSWACGGRAWTRRWAGTSSTSATRPNWRHACNGRSGGHRHEATRPGRDALHEPPGRAAVRVHLRAGPRGGRGGRGGRRLDP